MTAETETGRLRRGFSLLRFRRPVNNQLERKIGQEKPERVLVEYIALDPERSFTYEGTLRERKIPLFDKQFKDLGEGKVIRENVQKGEFVYEYELVHPNSRQPQFFHSSMEAYESGQIPFSETPEGIKSNAKMKRNVTIIINGLVITVDFAIILRAPFAFGSTSIDLFYIPVGLTIFFSILTYVLLKREKRLTLVRHPVMLEVAGSPEYRFAIPVNGNKKYIDELKRLAHLPSDEIESIARVLTNTNAEETASNRAKLEVSESLITSLRLALEKERQQRSDAITRGFEVKFRLPMWAKLTMISLALIAIGIPLFLLFG